MLNSRNSTPQSIPDPSLSIRRLGQVHGFDGLRGIAVLIVVVSHMEVILPIPTLLVIPGGTVSLDSFFVLSGFLITTLLLREQARSGRIGKLAFYRRRVLRLLPALLVVVVATALFAHFTNTWTPTEVPSILSVSFYYSNYYEAASSNAFCRESCAGIFTHVVAFLRGAVLPDLAMDHHRCVDHPHTTSDCSDRAPCPYRGDRDSPRTLVSRTAVVVLAIPPHRYPCRLDPVGSTPCSHLG